MDERAGWLLLIQGTEPAAEEDHLLRADITDYRIAPATRPGENSTNIATFADGSQGFHKPLVGVKAKLAGKFGHDPESTTINECAVWRLAQFMGSPYDDLVPTTVLRFREATAPEKAREPDLKDRWGSLSALVEGRQLRPEPLADAGLNDPAAFLDAVIANQDRHAGNFRWEAHTNQLGLFDHGFTFPGPRPRPNTQFNASVFLAQRHRDGRAALTDEVVNSPGLGEGRRERGTGGRGLKARSSRGLALAAPSLRSGSAPLVRCLLARRPSPTA